MFRQPCKIDLFAGVAQRIVRYGDAVNQEIEVVLFPALHGDALLLRCVGGRRPINILVDGGPRQTFEECLRPRLIALATAGEQLDLVVVTHTDADHIEGLLALVEENGDAASPRIIRIADFWHNSYRHLELNGRAATADEAERVLRQVADPGLRDSSGNISAKQGTTLAGLLRRRGYSWNGAFQGGAILGPRVVGVGDDVSVAVLSPGRPQLRRLSQFWRKGLAKLGVATDAVAHDAFEEAFERELLQYVHPEDQTISVSASQSLEPPSPDEYLEDESITNRSSIVMLLEFFGRRALLLGDAAPSVVLTGLEQLGRSAPFDVDWVKVAHHGSRRNSSYALSSLVRGRCFLISTDGTKHSHPDVEALLTILESQPQGRMLVFNYRSRVAELISGSEAIGRYKHRSHFVLDGRSLRVGDLEALNGDI